MKHIFDVASDSAGLNNTVYGPPLVARTLDIYEEVFAPIVRAYLIIGRGTREFC